MLRRVCGLPDCRQQCFTSQRPNVVAAAGRREVFGGAVLLTALVNMQQDAHAEVKGYEPMEVCCCCYICYYHSHCSICFEKQLPAARSAWGLQGAELNTGVCCVLLQALKGKDYGKPRMT